VHPLFCCTAAYTNSGTTRKKGMGRVARSSSGKTLKRKGAVGAKAATRRRKGDEGEGHDDAKAASATRPRTLRARMVRGVALLLLAVLLAPFLLIALYRIVPPPASSLMLIRLTEGAGLERQWVHLDEMGHLPLAVLVSEDNLFCRHNGVDWPALRTQVERVVEGESARGASTITMQTVKNLVLWPERSMVRKALEVPLAVYANLVWGKRRTMELYLNVAETGDGVYGVGAASERAFGVPPLALSPREATLIATTLPNPRARSAARPSNRMRRVSGVLLRRLKADAALGDCLKPRASGGG